MSVCKQLIDRANENGCPDNITVIAARFDGEVCRPRRPVTPLATARSLTGYWAVDCRVAAHVPSAS